MSRALLIDANLPRRYWFWALLEAVIRMNIMPCKQQGKSTTTTSKTKLLPTTPEIPQSTAATVPQSTEVAQPAKATPKPSDLTTSFELFHGVKPDYRTIFKWGSIGYFRHTKRSGKFDTKTRVGITLGRSNHTNAMIFRDPDTARMNVSADYKLDPMAGITQHFPAVLYDGQMIPLTL
jgi:hypothetical protein